MSTTAIAPILHEALRHAADGHNVFPLVRDGKKPAVRWTTAATTGAAQIRKWFGPDGRHRLGGLALRMGSTRTNPDTGATEWLVAIDVDMQSHGKDGQAALKTACAERGLNLDDFATRVQQTAGGGWHCLYWSPHPLKDCADVLGPASGVDIKCSGYIVVAPTVIEGKAYAWANPDAPIACLGELAQLFPEATPRAKSVDRAPLPGIDPERAQQRAIDYLATAERSVKGAGGDQCAYRVAAKLLALGLDEAGALDLMLSEHWDEGCGWSADRLAEKVKHAASYMQEPRGADAPEAVFDAVTESPSAEPPAARRYNLLSVGALLSRPPPTWLVRGLLPARGMGVVYGAPGSGKSFLVLDLAAAIARGLPWAGQRVKRGAVVYVGLEGEMGRRVAAYVAEHGVGADDLAGLHIIERQGLNLLDDKATDVRQLIADIQAAETGPVSAVIVDTLNRAMPGGNENASEDMGRAIRCAAKISAELNCLAVFVHHSGKDAGKGARGHSSLLGAADAELEVSRGADGENRFLEATKVKDGEDGARYSFRLKLVDLGPTSNYDPAAEPYERDSSCVVEGLGRAIVGATSKATQLTPIRANALTALRTALGGDSLGPVDWDESGSCSIDAWRAAYFDLVPVGEQLEGPELRQAENSRSRSFANAVDWLTAKKVVTVRKKKDRSEYSIVS